MVTRRDLLAGSAALAGLSGCAGGAAPVPAGVPGRPVPWRTLQGGFIAPALPGVGLPAPPGTGMFVRFGSTGALAVRGSDLLVADFVGGRLWRAELAGQSLVGIAAAPIGPGVALALGPDLSAWVLDPGAREVLRFGRDGRVLQSVRLPIALPSPSGLALADGGATLLVGDGLGAQWAEFRGGGPARIVAPEGAGGRIGSVDALLVAPDGHVHLLDRLQGVVHECTRDGRVVAERGRGDLMQPVALARDRHGRLYVHDAQDNAVKRLTAGRTAERFGAEALGAQRIGALAVDGLLMAVGDLLRGTVTVHGFLHEAAP